MIPHIFVGGLELSKPLSDGIQAFFWPALHREKWCCMDVFHWWTSVEWQVCSSWTPVRMIHVDVVEALWYACPLNLVVRFTWRSRLAPCGKRSLQGNKRIWNRTHFFSRWQLRVDLGVDLGVDLARTRGQGPAQNDVTTTLAEPHTKRNACCQAFRLVCVLHAIGHRQQKQSLLFVGGRTRT